MSAKCDLCYKRGLELNPCYIAGETFMLCHDCYESEANRGFIDGR